MTSTPHSPAALDSDRLADLLNQDGYPWPVPRVVASTSSTNSDLLNDPQAPTGTSLIALEQTAGRGRRGRDWASPRGSSVSVSVLLRVPSEHISATPWIPLLTGLSVLQGQGQCCCVDAALKWPNDVLFLGGPRPGKIAGVLAEAGSDGLLVTGFGINVALDEADLPVPEASSLRLSGCTEPDVARMLADILTGLQRRFSQWLAAGADAAATGLLAEYRAECATLGEQVRVSLPDGSVLEGEASDIDDQGRLVLAVDGQRQTISAGDVVHLR